MENDNNSRTIVDLIQQLAKIPGKPERVVVAVVESVDEEAKTCDVINADGSGIVIPSVRLQAQDGNGILIVPKVPSAVVVTMINSTSGHVTMFSDVEKVIYFDGSFGGLIKIQELIDKINKLENGYNDLVVKFNAHVHVTTCPAGAGTAAPTVSPETTVLSPTVKTDLENELVKHGK